MLPRMWRKYITHVFLIHSKIVWLFLIKQNMHLPYDPTVSLLIIYMGDENLHLHKNMHMNVHKALFMIAKKTPPNILQQVNSLWYLISWNNTE